MGTEGRLIAIEGIDGSGKSTQARILADSLGALLTHEPGDSSVGRALRQILLGLDGRPLSPRTEALLMAADRAQHMEEVVAPALAAGSWVVTDRFSASTFAYQGHGRGLPFDELEWLVRWATGGTEPDLTVLVDVDPALAAGRRGPADRFEGLDDAFHERVRNGYLEMAAADDERWVVVDGSRAVADVADLVRLGVASRLGSTPDGRR